MLECERVSVAFGGLLAVDDVSFAVAEGEIVGLIGPNGAGKTTLFNVITGFLRATAGRVRFRGNPIGGERPDRITARGIARTFQNIRLFRGMSALENVVIGRHLRTRATLLEAVLAAPAHRTEEARVRTRARELLDLVGLGPRAHEPAGALPYGDQRRLEIARALATEPRLLLLDEPAAGMNNEEKEDMARFILDVNEERGTSILMIEHDLGVVMDLSHRIYVLNFGRKIAEGLPEEVRGNREVQLAYVGGEAVA